MLTLIRKPTTGKIEAAPGEHDDCVMAYLIGLYVYLNASNLGEYGISRHMRRPDEKVEKTVESERQYRDRVKAAINVLPEQYRGIFEDFVRERDPITDAHQYAKDLRKAERDDPFNQLKMTRHRTMEVDEDQISLDKYMGRDGTQKVPEPKVGMEYFKMGETLQTPHYNYGRRDDALYIGDEPDDTLGEEERFTFEQGILDMNRPHEDEYGYPSYEDDDGFTFDPNDYA
jgi:phosphoglycolate phosphatase-like HAD superfamily hydrolase